MRVPLLPFLEHDKALDEQERGSEKTHLSCRVFLVRCQDGYRFRPFQVRPRHGRGEGTAASHMSTAI